MKKLYIVSRSGDRNVAFMKNGRCTLWMGGKGSDSKITLNNREGLLIENISDSGVKTILAGDVPYASMNIDMSMKKDKKVDYLVVPHHGSRMKYDVLNALYPGDRVAIIPADGVSHPNDDHKVMLDRNGFVVETTVNVDEHIDIKLEKILAYVKK